MQSYARIIKMQKFEGGNLILRECVLSQKDFEGITQFQVYFKPSNPDLKTKIYGNFVDQREAIKEFDRQSKTWEKVFKTVKQTLSEVKNEK